MPLRAVTGSASINHRDRKEHKEFRSAIFVFFVVRNVRVMRRRVSIAAVERDGPPWQRVRAWLYVPLVPRGSVAFHGGVP